MRGPGWPYQLSGSSFSRSPLARWRGATTWKSRRPRAAISRRSSRSASATRQASTACRRSEEYVFGSSDAPALDRGVPIATVMRRSVIACPQSRSPLAGASRTRPRPRQGGSQVYRGFDGQPAGRPGVGRVDTFRSTGSGAHATDTECSFLARRRQPIRKRRVAQVPHQSGFRRGPAGDGGDVLGVICRRRYRRGRFP